MLGKHNIRYFASLFFFTTHLSFLGVICVLTVDLSTDMCFCRNCAKLQWRNNEPYKEIAGLSGFQGEMFLWWPQLREGCIVPAVRTQLRIAFTISCIFTELYLKCKKIFRNSTKENIHRVCFYPLLAGLERFKASQSLTSILKSSNLKGLQRVLVLRDEWSEWVLSDLDSIFTLRRKKNNTEVFLLWTESFSFTADWFWQEFS